MPKVFLKVFFIKVIFLFQGLSAQESYLLDNFAEIEKDTLGKNHHFFISKYAVSVDDYKNYLDFYGLKLPEPPNYGWLQTQLPMVGVSYNDYLKYCHWLSDHFKIKLRAPTDEEWTVAAAHQENPTQKLSLSQPQEVDFIRPNKYDISGMNGNVWEWTSAKIDKDYHIIRGGSYLENTHPDTLNVQKIATLHPSLEIADVGFRLAMDATEMQKYQFAKKVAARLQQLFPEYTNLTADAKAIHINDGFISWDTSKNILTINEKDKFIQFSEIRYLKKSTNQFEVSEKFYFAKTDVEKVKELEELINIERKSVFNVYFQ